MERPLRLNFAAAPERIARIEDERAFQNLAKSKKRPGPAHDAEVAEGQARQEAIRGLLPSLEEETGGAVIQDRETFVETLTATAKAARLRLSAPERKAVLAALGERDPEAAICVDRHGKPYSFVVSSTLVFHSPSSWSPPRPPFRVLHLLATCQQLYVPNGLQIAEEVRHGEGLTFSVVLD